MPPWGNKQTRGAQTSIRKSIGASPIGGTILQFQSCIFWLGVLGWQCARLCILSSSRDNAVQVV